MLSQVNVGVGGVESEANVTEIHEALHLDELEGAEGGLPRPLWHLQHPLGRPTAKRSSPAPATPTS